MLKNPRKFPRMFALTAALLLTGMSSLAQAGALDDRVPQDAMLYFGWAGSDAIQPQYAQSNLKNIIAASAMEKFVTETFGGLIEREAGRNPGAKRDIDRAKLGLGIAWRHPVAFYFCPLDFTNANRPVPRMGLMCDAGADAKPLADLLTTLLTENPPPPDMPVKLVVDGNVVILTFGKADTAADLKAGGGLAATAEYKAAMERVKLANPAITAYGDIKKAIAMLNDALVKTNAPAEARERIPLVVESLGLNGLTQIAMNSGFEGKGWADRAFIGTNGPRKGIVALVDGQPLSDGILAAVPRDSAMFSAWKFDPNKVWNEIRSTAEKIEPRALQELDRGVADATRSLGIDIPKEIIAPLGDEWVLYRGPINEVEGSEFGMVVKLRDGVTLGKSLATLEKLFNAEPNMPLKVQKVTTGRVEVSALAFTGYSVAWTIRNNNLYISTLAGIAGAVKQVENKSPSIVENDLYKQARAAFPADIKPIQISYANPARLYPEIRRFAIGVLPLAQQAGITIPMEILPDSADVAQFMTPGASMTWVDNTGVHAAGNSAFPGAQLLGGQQMGPAVAVALVGGVAVAAPMAVRSQGSATLAVDAASLRGITQSSLVYAADRRDQMPDSIARLVADGMISPRQLVSRRSSTTPLDMTPELAALARENFARFKQQVDEHSDFVYLGEGTKSDADSSVILAYEKPGPNTPDGLNLAFRDGHVEFARWGGMTPTFESTNAYLKRNNRPEVDVKVLMQKAGVNPSAPTTGRGGRP